VYLAGTVTLDEATIASGTIWVYRYADYTELIETVPVSDPPSGWIVGVDGLDVGGPLYSLAITSGTDGKPYVGTWASVGTVGEAGTRGIGITASDRITSLDVVLAYLKAVSGGTTVNDPPVPLPVGLNLPDDWAGLLRAIANAGKYVALDLSTCTFDVMTGTVFDPVYSNSTGKAYITDLVLPNAATRIKAGGSYDNPTFKNFDNLNSVSGYGIKTVGDYDFYNCPKLTTVYLTTVDGDPLVESSIGHSAFAGCRSLTEVKLPKATSIGIDAFAGCRSLTEVDLQAATAIGIDAFSNCTSLEEVNLPSATSIGIGAFRSCVELTTVNLTSATYIGDYAFAYCSDLETVTLGSNAPTLGYDMFEGINALQTVTVYVPNENTGYDDVPATYDANNMDSKWGNGFRGMGWDGVGFPTDGFGFIETFITLSIVKDGP
jgi:hypothetical protein